MKNTHIGLIIVAAVVLIGGMYLFGAGDATGYLTLTDNETNSESTTEIGTDNPTSSESIYELTEFEQFSELISREKVIEEGKRPNREEYDVFPEIFEDLPAIPDDFGTMLYLFEGGLWRDLDYFTDAYYMQPEFYKAGENFEGLCLKQWTEPRPTMHTLKGWGAYPADMWINTYRGAVFDVKTFWFVPCGVEQYQGFNLTYFYPPNSQDDAEETYNNQNPSIVKDYFTVKIKDSEFLMGPTYPKFSVNPAYAKPVEVEITVHENAIPGEYVIGIDTITVSDKQHDLWLNEYKVTYNDAAGGMLSINRPHWRINIVVN